MQRVPCQSEAFASLTTIIHHAFFPREHVTPFLAAFYLPEEEGPHLRLFGATTPATTCPLLEYMGRWLKADPEMMDSEEWMKGFKKLYLNAEAHLPYGVFKGRGHGYAPVSQDIEEAIAAPSRLFPHNKAIWAIFYGDNQIGENILKQAGCASTGTLDNDAVKKYPLIVFLNILMSEYRLAPDPTEEEPGKKRVVVNDNLKLAFDWIGVPDFNKFLEQFEKIDISDGEEEVESED